MSVCKLLVRQNQELLHIIDSHEDFLELPKLTIDAGLGSSTQFWQSLTNRRVSLLMAVAEILELCTRHHR